MVFSPDKDFVASTHGDHNIYVSEVKTGKCIRTLSGHPRTPWCIAFHPSYPTVLASGCLGGCVRVWDIGSGGSEMWRTEAVIASNGLAANILCPVVNFMSQKFRVIFLLVKFIRTLIETSPFFLPGSKFCSTSE